MTILIEDKFSGVDFVAPHTLPKNLTYHEPNDDVLTCDGICHKPRPLCIGQLEQMVAKETTRAPDSSSHLTPIWLQMAQIVLRKSAEERTGGGDAVSATDEVEDAPLVESEPWVWSSPESAAEAVTGDDYPLLTLPAAISAPLSGIKPVGSFHPPWIQEALKYLENQAVGCSFHPSTVNPRATPPASRIERICALTGLPSERIANLASAGLSGLWYVILHKPEDMVEQVRAVGAFFNGVPYADELSVADQGGEWSHLANLAGPMLGAERLLRGPKPDLFERVLLAFHCCTVSAKPSLSQIKPSLRDLFLARFYDATLPSFMDCFKRLDPGSINPARVAGWGVTLVNDVYDYVSDGLSGRASNLCWAMGERESPLDCARMYRGTMISVARTSHYAPGALFGLLFMEYLSLYIARYCYYTVPCDTSLPLDDTYIPYEDNSVPNPKAKPVNGFRAAFRRAFTESAGIEAPHTNGVNGVNGHSDDLPPWKGLAATPCVWDDVASQDFDQVAARATHDVLGCLDRGVYAHSPELYYSHLAWLVRQYDTLVLAGRECLGVGRYYVANRIN